MFLVLFDAVLVRWLKITDKNWKKVEYLWLGAAALGLIGAGAQAGRFVGSNYIKNTEAKIALVESYADLRDSLEWGVDGGVCTNFQPQASSDKYLDEAVQEYANLCKKYTLLLARLPKELPPEAPSLEKLGFVMPQGQSRLVGAQIEMLEWRVKRYEEIRSAYSRWRSNVSIGDFEGALIVLGPLLIAFALALRITKVTGEIVHANRKL